MNTFLTKQPIYDGFDNFSLTHTFSIDVVANFLSKKRKKMYFFVSRALFLANIRSGAYFDQMSRCDNTRKDSSTNQRVTQRLTELI
jgi:hypothetical protein